MHDNGAVIVGLLHLLTQLFTHLGDAGHIDDDIHRIDQFEQTHKIIRNIRVREQFPLILETITL